MVDPTTSAISSSPAPSTSAVGGVTLEAIMAQLQHMDARLDFLSDEMCQVNTLIGRIACWEACLGGFVASSSPSPRASEDEDGDTSDDEDDDASSSSDDEMKISQWLTLCHLWRKGKVVLGMKVVLYLGGELV